MVFVVVVLFLFLGGGRVLLPGESQGQGSLVGCHLWGRTESDTTEATQQQQQRLLLLFLPCSEGKKVM